MLNAVMLSAASSNLCKIVRCLIHMGYPREESGEVVCFVLFSVSVSICAALSFVPVYHPLSLYLFSFFFFTFTCSFNFSLHSHSFSVTVSLRPGLCPLSSVYPSILAQSMSPHAWGSENMCNTGLGSSRARGWPRSKTGHLTLTACHMLRA